MAGGLGPQSGGSAIGGPLPSQSSPGTALPGQPIAGGSCGAGAVGLQCREPWEPIRPTVVWRRRLTHHRDLDAYVGRPVPSYP